MYAKEVSEASSPILKASFWAIILFVFIGSILIYFNTQSILKPLNQLKEKAGLVGKGDLTQKLIVKRKDEIGHLTSSFQKMQDSLRHIIIYMEKVSAKLLPLVRILPSALLHQRRLLKI